MKIKILHILAIMSFLLAGCGNKSLFSELAENKLKIIVKGTYESHNPRGWLSPMASFDTTAIFDDNSVQDIPVPDAKEVSPTIIMIDIAEMKLVKSDGSISKFSIFRQNVSGFLTDADALFNGSGKLLDNDDPEDGYYVAVLLYIRKMVIDGATVYLANNDSTTTGWSFKQLAQTNFWEKAVYGFNFNQFQLNSKYDSLLENADEINRIFPLFIPIKGGLEYSKKNKTTVLEIRLALKNFIKKYEYSDYPYVYHYYGVSDWLRDVQYGESATNGGNLLAVARSYVTDKLGSLNLTTTTLSLLNQMVLVIPSNDDIANYIVPATAARTNVANIPLIPSSPGYYSEPLLDYYLRLEAYRANVNSIISNPSFDTLEEYKNSWISYESTVMKYSLPGIMAFVTAFNSTTPVVIDNLAPGNYTIYRITAPAYGELFKGAVTSFTQLVNSVDDSTVFTVTAGTQTVIACKDKP